MSLGKALPLTSVSGNLCSALTASITASLHPLLLKLGHEQPDPTRRRGQAVPGPVLVLVQAMLRGVAAETLQSTSKCRAWTYPGHNSLLPELGCETSSHNTPASDSMITEPSASTSWATHKHSNGSMMQLLPTGGLQGRANRTPPCLPPLQTETRPPVQVLVRVPAPAGHPLPQFGTAAPS